VDQPTYSAILFRRTYADLALPDALMDRSHRWLRSSGAKWVDDIRTWRFPNGATLSFGYLDSGRDKYRYQGAQFQFIGFDELTQFPEDSYTYMFSRLRRLQFGTGGAAGNTIDVPLRMRGASNPNDEEDEGEWVYERFVDPRSRLANVVFVPARLEDNPYLDQETYDRMLQRMGTEYYERMRNGVWIRPRKKRMFSAKDFKVIEIMPRNIISLCRFWDLAATPSTSPDAKNADWTSGTLMAVDDHFRYFIIDVIRAQYGPTDVEQLVEATASQDGPQVKVRMKQDPGQAGVHQIAAFYRILAQYDFRSTTLSGNKEVNARPLAAQVGAGNVYLLRGDWNREFLIELEKFPPPKDRAHDDQVDAAAGAYNILATEKRIVPYVRSTVSHGGWSAATPTEGLTALGSNKRRRFGGPLVVAATQRDWPLR
jgi:predicted phage terminase large subunit-like protein